MANSAISLLSSPASDLVSPSQSLCSKDDLTTQSYWHPHTSEGHTSTLTISDSTVAQHCWRESYPQREGCFYTKMTLQAQNRPLILSASPSSQLLSFPSLLIPNVTGPHHFTTCCPHYFLTLQTMSSSPSANPQEPPVILISMREIC